MLNSRQPSMINKKESLPAISYCTSYCSADRQWGDKGTVIALICKHDSAMAVDVLVKLMVS